MNRILRLAILLGFGCALAVPVDSFPSPTSSSLPPTSSFSSPTGSSLPPVGSLGSPGSTGGAQQPRQGEVQVWEDEIVIPTYPLGPDDLNPQFFELTGSPIYPYTMQDSFSTERIERSYRVMVLENEYLRIVCLPEIGGRIHSVFDKLRGEEMFHVNQVIKPGHIALRGAWVSGGVEWNRGPQGHTVTSFSPVDVVGVSNPDGSASLVIGYTELNFRTGWSVRLTLHPGRAYLDERIEIFNPTDGFHPYYFWNNTAFPQRDGTRFIYPMMLGSDHDGVNFFSWPEHQGRDLTWLKNYPGPTSVFGYQVPFDFFGAYDVDRDFGIVQVADHRVLPGKKAWTWGQSDAGMVAQSALTDDDGPYIEVQSGPLPTQADFAMLMPGQRVAWQEYWYPVAGLTDGFEFATRDMAVQRRDAGTSGTWNSTAGGGPVSGVELRFLSTARFPGARLRVLSDGRALLARTVDLDPRAPEVVTLDVAPGARVSIDVTSAEGRELLRYESPLALSARVVPEVPAPLDAARATLEERYLEGLDHDKKGDRTLARQGYEAALAADSSYTDALVGLAVLDAEAGLYQSAKERLDDARHRDPEDGMVAYLRGVSSLHLGSLDAAMADAAAATKLHGSAALGYGLRGRAQMRLGEYGAAAASFAAGLDEGGADRARLSEHLMLALYAAGEAGRARTLALSEVAAGTVRLAPWAVSALAADRAASGSSGLDDAAAHFAGQVDWVGEAEFAHLELAFALVDVGLLNEAAALARAALVDGRDAPRPLPLYTLAWLQHQLGNRELSSQRLLQARRSTADHVFPSRPEMLEVLEFAVGAEPTDSGAHEYRGNVLAGLGRFDEARVAWQRAAELDETRSVARRNLGLMAWRRDGDLGRAAALYKEAIAARPDDQTLVRDLARVWSAAGDVRAAIDLLEGVAADRYRRPDILVLLAASYVEVADYDAAIKLLAGATFNNREGVSDTWEIFSRAHIERGIRRLHEGVAFREREGPQAAAERLTAARADFEAALTYPVNLNAGRPHEPIEARAQYWRGVALEALGNEDGARQAWTECAAGVSRGAQQQVHMARCAEKLR